MSRLGTTMHGESIEEELTEIFEEYRSGFGPIDWQTLRESGWSVPRSESFAEIFNALAFIEADSRYQHRKIQRARLDRYSALRGFNALWLIEESEHGRMFRHVAMAYGSDGRQPGAHLPGDHRRILSSYVATSVGRLTPQLVGTYCALGAIQEHVALTTYRYLATAVSHHSLGAVLLATARQESRHLRFYRSSAEVVLKRSRSGRALARSILSTFWRPPGVDLLGLEGFIHRFGSILADEEYRRRLRRMDTLLDSMPGLEDLGLMERFLEVHCG